MLLKRLDTPILLIGFNRPDLFEIVLNRVLEVKPRRIYVGLDGAREGRKDDEDSLKKIKKLVSGVKKCEVKTCYQTNNLGCKYGPVTAMNWFFDNEKMGIILEDDVLADKSFFYYCQELLEKYKNDMRIGSISGNNFQFRNESYRYSYYFSRYSHSCGWATWRRAWKSYDINLIDYKINKNEVLNKVFNKLSDKIYWKIIFSGIINNQIESAWDYQWNWNMWKHKMLGIIPNSNLVKNLGFGRVDATHTKFRSKFANLAVKPMIFPLKHPKFIKRNLLADGFTQKNNYVLWKELGLRLYKKIF